MGSLIAPTGGMVYLDANVIIYHLEGYPRFAGVLTELFERLDNGALRAATSELTLAEVLVKPIRMENTVARQTYEAFLAGSAALTVVPVTRAVLIAAAALRAVTPLKLPDAIHAATAASAGCTAFLTNDSRFDVIPSLSAMVLSKMMSE